MEKYTEIFKYFIKLGFVAFGGPAAHMAMMENDLVENKKWMTKQEFLDYIGITNLIPGPNSTELTMHCGYHRGGFIGLVIAGMSFIFPAVLLTGAVAYLFFRYEDLSLLKQVTDGFKIIVLLIIAQASYKLFNKAVKNNYYLILALVFSIIYWFYPHEVILLLAVVGISVMKYWIGKNQLNSLFPIFFFFSNQEESISSIKIFLSFLKVGSILFGSGYVLFAYLDSIFIQELGIMSGQQLLDAIAIGQFTPGPVLSTATFVGYQLGSWSGAVAATIGIFLPSFVFVAFTSPFVNKIRKNPMLGELLDGVNAVSLAFIVVVAVKLAAQTITNWQGGIVVIFGAIAIFVLRWNPILVLLLGGLAYVGISFF